MAEKTTDLQSLQSAMVDRNIEAIGVEDGDKGLFIDPVNKKSNQQIVQVWAKKGSLLTLTSSQAVRCGIADKLVFTREELLRELNASGAEVAMDEDLSEVTWITSGMAK